MNVSAIIVTRGDVERHEVIESLPKDWEILVWDNGGRELLRKLDVSYAAEIVRSVQDLKVYGRYAAIDHARGDLIYVQDDDVVMHPGSIEEIVREWKIVEEYNLQQHPAMPYDTHVVCNMPAAFRARHFYDEHSLVGFGACFHRSAPGRAFKRFFEATGRVRKASSVDVTAWELDDDFLRTCDIVFTALTPRVLVDVPYDDLPWASADNRMWKQSWHQSVRDEMLDTVLKVRKETS